MDIGRRAISKQLRLERHLERMKNREQQSFVHFKSTLAWIDPILYDYTITNLYAETLTHRAFSAPLETPQEITDS